MLQDERTEREENKLQQQKDRLEEQMGNQSLEVSISRNGGARSKEDEKIKKTPYLHRANLFFLDSSTSEEADYAPSPLRKGNFDLLTLLTTQEAIHRVLNDPQRKARKSPEYGSNQFLQDFYVQRLLSHFSGDQPYGRADDFLEEMLACSPRMITIGNDKEKENDSTSSADFEDAEDELTKDLTYLIDPLGIAETILNEREKVALEWKQQLEDQTKTDHMAIQKMVLAKLMGSKAEECNIVDAGGNLSDDIDESCFE